MISRSQIGFSSILSCSSHKNKYCLKTHEENLLICLSSHHLEGRHLSLSVHFFRILSHFYFVEHWWYIALQIVFSSHLRVWKKLQDHSQTGLWLLFFLSYSDPSKLRIVISNFIYEIMKNIWVSREIYRRFEFFFFVKWPREILTHISRWPYDLRALALPLSTNGLG